MIKNGSTASASDIEKNTITYLEGINQNTILSQDASITDKTYTYADSDTFSDSTGYNNTVDTGNTDDWLYYNLDSNNEYRFSSVSDYSGASDYYLVVEASSLSSTININDCHSSLIGDGKWIIYCDTGTANVKRAQIIKTLFYGTNGTDAKINTFTSVTAIRTSSSSDEGLKFYMLDSNVSVSGPDPGAYPNNWGTKNATFSDTTSNSLICPWSNLNEGGASNGDATVYFYLPPGTAINGTNYYSYEIGTDRTSDQTSNETGFQIKVNYGNQGSASFDIDLLIGYKSGSISWDSSWTTYNSNITVTENSWNETNYTTPLSALTGNEFDTTASLQTNSKTFSSNVSSILVNANKVLNGNSTINIDVSTDGGTTWDVTSQALDSIIELDGDDTDVVVKFNLNVDSGNTPELYGYSYQVWT